MKSKERRMYCLPLLVGDNIEKSSHMGGIGFSFKCTKLVQVGGLDDVEGMNEWCAGHPARLTTGMERAHNNCISLSFRLACLTLME